MSKPRNLKVDLEICNRASKAPWIVATNKHPTTSGNSWGWVEGTRENWCWSNDNKKSYADARFIAQAREGWPHAIERALKAENLNRELAKMLDVAVKITGRAIFQAGKQPDADYKTLLEFVKKAKEVLDE